jgi:hypothetical protein
VGVIAILNAVLDTTRPSESGGVVPQDAGLLRLLVPGVAIGVIIDCRCVLEGVEVTR